MTSITRELLQTYAFNRLEALTDGELDNFAQVSEKRLLARLCMEEGDQPVEGDDNYSSWLMLFTNFVVFSYEISKAGARKVASKNVRNFSISYGDDGAINFDQFINNFSDLIGEFSLCKVNVSFVGGKKWADEASDEANMSDLYPDTSRRYF